MRTRESFPSTLIGTWSQIRDTLDGSSLDDGEMYIVNYILDDAPKAQIRGYSLQMKDFRLGN